MMKDLNLKVENVNGNELIVRTGEAAKIIPPVQITLEGDINSISSFLKKRATGFSKQAVDANKAIVAVDKKALTIALYLDPEDPMGTIVKGSLELSDELKIFHINQTKTFTRDELIKLIKFNRLCFDDNDQHAALLKAYQTFTAQTATDLKQDSDTRGNKANSFSKQVSTQIPLEFILLIPVFKGKEGRRFRVEICLDVTDGGARFWFESTELHELIKTETEILFNEELKSCAGFVIINE